MKSRIIYDLVATQPNHDGDFHGGGKYGKKVFLHILSQDQDLKQIIFPIYDSSKPLDTELKSRIESLNLKLVDIRNSNLPEVVGLYDINRLYSPLPFGLLKYGLKDIKSRCEIFGTIHGLRTLEIQMKLSHLKYVSSKKPKIYLKSLLKAVFSNYIAKRDWNRYQSLFKYVNLITVSDHTKNAILAFFPQMKAEIPVFYSPDVTEFQQDDDADVGLEYSDYYLMVSGNRWLKNNLTTAIALDELFSERPNTQKKVIITGVKDVSVYSSKLKNKDLFIFLNYVSEKVLNSLYKNAYAFMYLSLNEGFGYPPLEAMKWSVPVITSPFTSIPEICGDAVLYSNPNSVSEIKTRVLQLTNFQEYKRLQKSAIDRYNIIRQRQDTDLEKMAQFILG